MVKNTSALLIVFLIAITAGITSNTYAATLQKQFVSTSTDSSTLKETVQGCSDTSKNQATLGNTIANLYDDGSFQLGYSTRVDDHLNAAEGDKIVLTGIWSTIDTAGTKFRFQPNGNLAIGNGTLGWLQLYNWTFENACVGPQSNNNQYNLTYPATFRIMKSDMTLKTSNNSGTLRFTLQGYGQTTESVATPPQTAPLMKYDMQVKGFWDMNP